MTNPAPSVFDLQSEVLDLGDKAVAALRDAAEYLEGILDALADLDAANERARPTQAPLPLKMADLAITSALSFLGDFLVAPQ